MLDISELGYSCLEGSAAMIWRWYTEGFIVQFVFSGKNSPTCLSFPLVSLTRHSSKFLPNIASHKWETKSSVKRMEENALSRASTEIQMPTLSVSGASVLLRPLSTYSLKYCQAVQRSGHTHTSDCKHRKALSKICCFDLVFEYKLWSKANNEHSSNFLLLTSFVY